MSRARVLFDLCATLPFLVARETSRAATKGFTEEEHDEWKRIQAADRQRKFREKSNAGNTTPGVIQFPNSNALSEEDSVTLVGKSNAGGSDSSVTSLPSAPALSPTPPIPPTPTHPSPYNPPTEVRLGASAAADDEPSDHLPAAPAVPAASRPVGLGEKGEGGAEDEAAKAARKAEGEAKTAVMLRLGKLYRRMLKTEWSDKEKAALKKLWEADSFQGSIDEIEAYYLLPATVFPMNGRERKREDYRRHDLVTLLNNWWSELGKARKFFELNPQHRPRKTAVEAGPVRLTAAFLEWIRSNYPRADFTLSPSIIVRKVGEEFRRAHPNTPLTEPNS